MRSKFDKAKELNKDLQNKVVSNRSQSQNYRFGLNVNKDKISNNQENNIGNNTIKRNENSIKYENTNKNFFKKNAENSAQDTKKLDIFPSIIIKKQTSETFKEKSLFENNNNQITGNILLSSFKSNSNISTNKNIVLNSPSFSNVYFADKSKLEAKINVNSSPIEVFNDNTKYQGNNISNNVSHNISKNIIETSKEFQKPIIIDSSPQSKNNEKPNLIKPNDSPFKKMNDQVNSFNSSNSSLKMLNNNSSVTSSSLSNPLEKVYLAFVGLSNLGNTCFMNTSLQILIHSSKFITEFLQKYKQFNLNEGSIASEFYNLLKEVSISNYSVSPTSFKEAFGRKHRKFNGYSQHDSQELLRHLLEDISSEMNLSKSKVFRELDTKDKSLLVLNDDYHKLFLERENSVVTDIFYGQFCNTFLCSECRFKTYSFEKFIDIPILLDSGVYNIDIAFLLKKHFQEEEFHWDSPCENPKCKKKCEHKKTTRISRLPSILTISIQRYNYRSKSKNSAKLSFTEKFDFYEYCESECIKDDISTYRLYGISNHSGNLDFGHYYAYCNINNEWREFNDSSVYKCYNFSFSSQTAYVLFYEKIK